MNISPCNFLLLINGYSHYCSNIPPECSNTLNKIIKKEKIVQMGCKTIMNFQISKLACSEGNSHFPLLLIRTLKRAPIFNWMSRITCTFLPNFCSYNKNQFSSRNADSLHYSLWGIFNRQSLQIELFFQLKLKRKTWLYKYNYLNFLVIPGNYIN